MKNADKGLIEDFSLILPKAGQRLTVYAEFLSGIQDRLSHHNRCLGYISWVTGKVLLLARPACSRKGDWSQFLNTIVVSPGKTLKPGTARLLMQIARQVDEHEAKRWSYTEMLARIYPDTYGKDVKSLIEDESAPIQKTVKRRSNKPMPLTATGFENESSKILRMSQRLAHGFTDSGKPIETEMNCLRNSLRAIESSINDLNRARELISKRIGKLKAA